MQKPFALFDFDGTLCPGDSLIPFCLYAYKRGLCSFGQLLRVGLAGLSYALHLTDAGTSKQRALGFLAGKTRSEVARIARDFCREKLIPRLYPQGVEAVRRCHEQGAAVLLVSASPELYLTYLRQALPIDGIIATRMHVDENDRYTGLMAGENCRGVQKPLRLAEYLAAQGDEVDYAASFAYGDSGGDAPMMELCANKMAVNPRKKLLKRLTGSQGVTVLRWPRA